MKNSGVLFKVAALALMLCLTNCKKDKTNTTPDDPSTGGGNTNTDKKYALIIDNGAQSMEVGQTLNLSAHLVSSTGAVINATGVTWSSNIGGVSGSSFSTNTETIGIISASVQYEGVTYTSAIPVSVQGSGQMFGVVPSAIIWSTNSGPIQLNTVYLNGTGTYAFTSQDPSIASVSGSGLVTFNAAGNTSIKVEGTINGQKSTVVVPVMVVGLPDVPLPVARVVVTPALGELFRGETLQLVAKAYNSKGEDVSSTVTFNYAITPKLEEDEEPAIAANISNTGVVKALTVGGAYVNVTANGVMGQAEIVVNPDTVIVINPFFVNLGGMDFSQLPPVQNPTSQVLTATTQKVDRAKYRAKDPGFLITIPNSPNLMWELPETGNAQIDEQFKVVTLENKTNTSVTVKAIQGKVGSTVVVAHAGIYGGAASVLVNP